MQIVIFDKYRNRNRFVKQIGIGILYIRWEVFPNIHDYLKYFFSFSSSHNNFFLLLCFFFILFEKLTWQIELKLYKITKNILL